MTTTLAQIRDELEIACAIEAELQGRAEGWAMVESELERATALRKSLEEWIANVERCQREGFHLGLQGRGRER